LKGATGQTFNSDNYLLKSQKGVTISSIQTIANELEQLATGTGERPNDNGSSLRQPQENVPQVVAMGGQEAPEPATRPGEANNGERPSSAASEQSASVDKSATKGAVQDSGVVSAQDAESLTSHTGEPNGFVHVNWFSKLICVFNG
jgi:hypothetical protein